MALNLWRTTKSPEATFPLIHGNEFGQYDIQGTALSVIENEATLRCCVVTLVIKQHLQAQAH
jgi:hypothetical protein